jgi:hypothetical protein
MHYCTQCTTALNALLHHAPPEITCSAEGDLFELGVNKMKLLLVQGDGVHMVHIHLLFQRLKFPSSLSSLAVSESGTALILDLRLCSGQSHK